MMDTLRTVSAGVLALASCGYSASFSDCVIACAPLSGCPSGLTCIDDRCRTGETQTACATTATDGGNTTPDQCAYLEPNDTLATAAVYAPSGASAGAICTQTPIDHDFYKIEVPPNISVTFQLTFSAGGDLDLRLYDASGTQLAQSRGVTTIETITCPSQTGCGQLVGSYVVEVYPSLDNGENAYRLDVGLVQNRSDRKRKDRDAD